MILGNNHRLVSNAVIEVDALTRGYGPNRGIEGVQFDVMEGEVVGFLGPNGAGKSTTMRILAGTLRAHGGHARICGFDVATQAIQARRRIGYLPEHPPLDPHMGVAEYLTFAAVIRRVPKRAVDAAVTQALDATGLVSVRERLIGHLSKGFQQRVGIAQALVHDPKVLILDEPTAGLDPKQVQEVRNLIGRLAGTRTVLLSTHILQEVTATCQRVIVIDDGRVVAQDSLEGLERMVTRSEVIRLAVFEPSNELRQRLLAIPDVEEVIDEGEGRMLIHCASGHDRRPEVAQAAVASGLLELSVAHLDLQEVFLKLLEQPGTNETMPEIST